MPEFPNPPPELTQDRALQLILSSIAYEELALSHILNAEGEKIQYTLESARRTPQASVPEEVLAVNKSVSNLLEIVLQNQMILKNKMERVLEFLPKPQPPCPPAPPTPPQPPPPPCGESPVCIRKAAVPGVYGCGEALRWRPIPICPCDTGGPEEGPCRIPLPWAGLYKIRYFFEFQTAGSCRSAEVLELRVLCSGEQALSRRICALTEQRHTAASGEILLPCPRPACNMLWIVTSPAGLTLWQGGLSCLPVSRQLPTGPNMP